MKHLKPPVVFPSVRASSEPYSSSFRPQPESAFSPTLAPERILRLPEVLATVNIGRTSLYKMVKAGTFPAPVRLSDRIRGWKLSSIQQFLASLEDK